MLSQYDRPLRNNGTKMYAQTGASGDAIENRFTLLIKSALYLTPATRTSQQGQQILWEKSGQMNMSPPLLR